MFIQRLLTFTLIVFCGVLLSVKNVCLSEVYDPGSAWLLPSPASSLSIITINFLSKQNKREPLETAGTQEALETGSQLVTNRLLTGVAVISLLVL